MIQRKPIPPTPITDLTHPQARRTNIPTAEHQAVMRAEDLAAVAVTYPRASGGLQADKAQRNPDLDPQLVWRGKEGTGEPGEAENLTVHAPPLYIQEKVKPKVLIDDLRRTSKNQASQPAMENIIVQPFLNQNTTSRNTSCARSLY